MQKLVTLKLDSSSRNDLKVSSLWQANQESPESRMAVFPQEWGWWTQLCNVRIKPSYLALSDRWDIYPPATDTHFYSRVNISDIEEESIIKCLGKRKKKTNKYKPTSFSVSLLDSNKKKRDNIQKPHCEMKFKYTWTLGLHPACWTVLTRLCWAVTLL